jgi:toxin ParE1/3/4
MPAYLTPQAEADLEEIADYIAQNSLERAVLFIQEIRQHCGQIADGPKRYASRPELGESVRMCVHGSYLILFELDGNDVLVVRVLHGARNLIDFSRP